MRKVAVNFKEVWKFNRQMDLEVPDEIDDDKLQDLLESGAECSEDGGGLDNFTFLLENHGIECTNLNNVLNGDHSEPDDWGVDEDSIEWETK
jgi:hypothetical protein